MEFVNELGSARKYIAKIKGCSIKFGAFEGGNLVGFIVANPSGKKDSIVLASPAFWVRKGYRKRGIGKKLVLKILSQSKRTRLAGMDINQMTYGTTQLVEKLGRHVAQRTDRLSVSMGPEPKLKTAHLRFHKR